MDKDRTPGQDALLFFYMIIGVFVGVIQLFVFIRFAFGLDEASVVYDYGGMSYLLSIASPIIGAATLYYLYATKYQMSRAKPVLLVGVIFMCIIAGFVAKDVKDDISTEEYKIAEQEKLLAKRAQRDRENKLEAERLARERARNVWPRQNATGYLCYRMPGMSLVGVLTFRRDLIEPESCRVIIRELTGSDVKVEFMDSCAYPDKYAGDQQWVSTSSLHKDRCK